MFVNVHKCPCHVKEKCFNALVRPLVEYANSLWDPHKQTQIDKLEKINKRAASFITGNCIFANGNTERKFSLLGWSTLQERPTKLKVTMLYKICDDLICISKKYLIPATSLRYRLIYVVPHSKLERHLHSLFSSSIPQWNHLPSEIKLFPDLLKFKSAVQNFQLTQPISNHDFVCYEYYTIAQSYLTLNFLAPYHPNFWPFSKFY